MDSNETLLREGECQKPHCIEEAGHAGPHSGDIPDPLEAAQALVAAASPGPWRVGYQGRGEDVWSKPEGAGWHDADLLFVPSQPRGARRIATSRLTTVAVNTFIKNLEALKGLLAYTGPLELLVYPESDVGVHDDVANARAALAHVAREISDGV